MPTKTTDIIMFNSRNLGIEESYGFGMLNEGQAIAVAKNVKVRQNEMSTPGALIISIGSDYPVFESPSELLGGAPFDVNKDNYDLTSVSFVS